MKKITILAFVLLAVAALLYAVDALIVEPNGDVRTTAHLLVGGNVEADGRVYDRSGELVLVGTINAYGGSTVPVGSGWLLCNGASLSSTDYPELFTVIGTSFGNGSTDGDGNLASGDFNLPDLRGRFARGLDTTDSAQDPRDPDRATRTVGSFQDDAFQGHRHAEDYEIVYGGSFGAGTGYSGGNVGEVGDPINDGINGDPRISSETRPDNVAVNYIIKY